jgi:predicted phage terminase large subunit-like protein
VTNSSPSPAEAAAELLRRDRAKESLAEFALGIDVPGKPISENEDEWLFEPIETHVALHHRVLLNLLDHIHSRTIQNAMVFMPPGSAKSTYASVVYPAYAMGKRPGSRFILASYASAIAWKQSRRTRQIVRSPKYQPIFDCALRGDNAAVEAWGLDNGSEYMAGGILAGMTGNRATDLIIDDPVAGREEADSEVMQKRTREAYEDDLSTRLMPGGSTLIIQTRWNENDLSGGILPADWSGESGTIRGRDGQNWFVLCVPALADRKDDPLGRRIGDRLWPEWFTADHFEKFKANSRTWNALFQQKPTADEGDFFKTDYFAVRWNIKPPNLRVFGASDYAVTPDGGDYTEHGVFGLDDNNVLYVLDWWSGQTPSDVWIERLCDMIVQHGPQFWVGESGVIRRAVEPYMTTRMSQRRAMTRLEWLPSTGDKEARARGAQAMASMGHIRFPLKCDFADRVIKQLAAFPAGAFDDAVDVISIAARAIPLAGAVRRPRARVASHTVIDSATGLLG